MLEFVSPLQDIEGIMALLRNKSLWDTVHGQGTSERGLGKECISIPRSDHCDPEERSTTWELLIPQHVAWQGGERKEM